MSMKLVIDEKLWKIVYCMKSLKDNVIFHYNANEDNQRAAEHLIRYLKTELVHDAIHTVRKSLQFDEFKTNSEIHRFLLTIRSIDVSIFEFIVIRTSSEITAVRCLRMLENFPNIDLLEEDRFAMIAKNIRKNIEENDTYTLVYAEELQKKGLQNKMMKEFIDVLIKEIRDKQKGGLFTKFKNLMTSF